MSGAKRSPAKVAADLERTARGRNVRALLLRVAEREDIPVVHGSAALAEALRSGKRRGLVLFGAFDPVQFTPLGREVADACRPKPWTANNSTMTVGAGDRRVTVLRCSVFEPTGRHSFTVDTVPERECTGMRIAALLTADDLERAKTFEPEDTP